MNTDCNKANFFISDRIFRFIEESNNENLIKKYRNSFLIYQYFIFPFFPNEYENYLKIIYALYEIVEPICYDIFNNCKGYEVFKIIGIIILTIVISIYIITIPIFPHFAIKKLYYCKFIKEFKREHNNAILFMLIIIGEEILFLILIFPLMIIHYLYHILFFPILFLIGIIRKMVYGI